jgi:hypothetical protein
LDSVFTFFTAVSYTSSQSWLIESGGNRSSISPTFSWNGKLAKNKKPLTGLFNNAD